MSMMENRTFDEIAEGDSASIERKLTQEDIQLFAVVSGDTNPAHLDADFAKTDIFHEIIAHGMWGGALISSVLGTKLPGAGTIYLEQSIRFCAPVKVGDIITVTVTVAHKEENKKRLKLECHCTNQAGESVIEGCATVIAPTEKVRRKVSELPAVLLRDRRAQLSGLIEKAKQSKPARTAVVHPVGPNSLKGAMDAYEEGLIIPVLVGPEHRIRTVAKEHQIDLTGAEIVSTEHSHAAAALAVKMVHEGDVHALMKGSLHTDEFMGAIVDKKKGIRTDRRMSHIYVIDVPSYHKPLLITDAAINIYPDLPTKVDIVKNAIDLAQAIGLDKPKVALISAVETITPKIPTTLDAAALCKMADRKQITGAILDGPLAFDNAISKRAAEEKGIDSVVAGDADVLVAPDLEAGNMLAKQLVYLADAHVAALVMGARVPIILTSRADDALTRVGSCALALLVKEWQHHQPVK